MRKQGTSPGSSGSLPKQGRDGYARNHQKSTAKAITGPAEFREYRAENFANIGRRPLRQAKATMR
jgi:hypothetical protein